MDASKRRRRLPSLTEELFEEILLRFPPDEPKFLFRATLVCKDWRLLLSSARFRRRFCEHHQTAPMLGYSTSYFGFKPVTKSPFASLSEVRPIWRQPIDALAGRILFDDWATSNIATERINLAVWNSMDGDVRRLPKPGELPPLRNAWSAALACTAPGCSHLNCAGNGPFQVVLVVDMTSWSDEFSSAATFVYSSEHHKEWSKNPVTVQLPYPGDSDGIAIGPAARSQNALYFSCEKQRNSIFLDRYLRESEKINTILEYDLGKQELSLVSAPSAACKDRYTALVILEDGTLGFATVRQYQLHMWLRKTGEDGDARWTQHRVIDLMKNVCASAVPSLSLPRRVFPAANSAGFAFIATTEWCFIVDLKSGRVTRLFQESDIVPFRSFCTPAGYY